jgi:hypothetical protein
MLLMGAHLGIWHQGRDGAFLIGGNSNELAGLTSNLVSGCGLLEPGAQENLWREVTFEWTKPLYSASSNDSFPVGKTNIEKL